MSARLRTARSLANLVARAAHELCKDFVRRPPAHQVHSGNEVRTQKEQNA